MIPRAMIGFVIAAGLLAGRYAQAEDGPSVKAAEVTVADLFDVTGLDIYKCQVDVKKGERLRSVLYWLEDEDAKPKKYVSFETVARQDGQATFLASFLREDRMLASVLTSEEPRMEFHLTWSGAADGGQNGNLENPLGHLPRGTKAIEVHKAPKRLPDGSSELFQLYRVEHDVKGLTYRYPRVSLRIEPVK